MPEPPLVAEDDSDSLARYLLSFTWPGRDAVEAQALVAHGLPIWRAVLARVPRPARRGRALELGSPPFHITLLLRRFRDYDFALAASAADDRASFVEELTSREFGERHRMECRCFDVERDRFPYPDASFDLVLWCEVIEHLQENPVQAVSEIHRVLVPGGLLVLSTPNVARADNVLALLRGDNVFDPYHLGSPFRGTRHLREYTAAELGQLLGGCGFEVVRVDDLDLRPPRTVASRAARAGMRVLGRLAAGRHGEHLFVVARRGSGSFRWGFPAGLFDRGHLGFWIAPRAGRVIIGENDVPHLHYGWGTQEVGPAGRAMRRCRLGDAYLVTGAANAVYVTVTGGRAEVAVWEPGESPELLAWKPIEAPAGDWRRLRIPLTRAVATGRLHVRFEAPEGIGVSAIEVATD